MSAERNEPPAREARLIALETKLMFLENTLESLSEVVLAQGRQLERLARRIDEQLGEAGERVEGAGETRALADDVPPHY